MLNHFLVGVLVSFASAAGAQVVVMPKAAHWGDWQLISEEKDSGAALRWFSLTGEPKSKARDLLFISIGPDVVDGVAMSQFVAVAALKKVCKGARFNAPKPRVESDGAVAFIQKYCDHDSTFDSGVVSFTKIIYSEGFLATISRVWRVPIGQARTVESSNPEETIALIKERGEVIRYLSEQVALCASEEALQSCRR
jgi:hypothetical protein